MVLEASLSTVISYDLFSASGDTVAVNFDVLDDVAMFWVNMSIDETPNLASVTFSILALNDENIDFIADKVFCDSWIFSFFSSKVATFACLNLTSDSTHDDVSKPDANPLNDIVTILSCTVITWI